MLSGFYLQVFRQAAVINLYEGFFSQNSTGCPLAAGLIWLGAPLQQNNKRGMSFSASVSISILQRILTVYVYLPLADIVHGSRAKWQPDILHFTGL